MTSTSAALAPSSRRRSAFALDRFGDVYGTDFAGNSVRKFAPDGTLLLEWQTFGGRAQLPVGIAIDSFTNVHVTDGRGDRVQMFTSTGTKVAEWDAFGSGDGELFGAADLAVDARDEVYVADTGNNRTQISSVPSVTPLPKT